ncbi:ATP-binding protein [Hoeflea olei]|uniref:histidine kinase n=1 Tax=Hoeflea olei TaxID=1480615 RepID=A0A1C1YTK6_9HYPH|nr:ATP-binding protein [Hoeflea olei]OCW56858.1 hypothetical protein AWJ14_06755 [Hoeflea olei]
MQAHHYPFIDLAVHASVRERFARGDAVAVLSESLDAVLWANGAAADLLGFDNIYDALDDGLGGRTATQRQIESALSALRRTGRPQTFMMRMASGFARAMTPATLEDITLPDGARALLMTSSQAGTILAPGARARRIISGFEGTGTHVAVLDRDGIVLAATSTFDRIGLAPGEIARMVADVAGAGDRLVKRMTQARIGAMPAAIGRLADDPALHLLFAVEPPQDEAGDAAEDRGADPAPEAETELTLDPNGHDSSAADGFATAGALSSPDLGASKQAAGDDRDGAAAHSARPAETAPETQARETQAPKPVRFDISRIRAELNARLEKAQAEQARAERDVPPPFAEARNLVVGLADNDGEADDAPEPLDTQEATARGEAAPEDATAEDGARMDTTVGAAENSPDTGAEDARLAVEDDAALTATRAPADDASTEQDEPGEPSIPAEEPDASAEATPQPAGDTAAHAETAAAEAEREDAPRSDAARSGAGMLHAEGVDMAAAHAADTFRFDPEARPARFVWKINREGKFSEVSPEFAAAVGPNSADILGRSFPDLARVFNLDPDHVIADLLNRRDTWSGKTVYWPIQGTALSTPVDLAALPTYTRDRQFDGFRGFGIVRLGETRPDPEALGLALVPGAQIRSRAQPPSPVEPASSADAPAPETDETDWSEFDTPHDDDEADLELREAEQDLDDLVRLDGAGDEDPATPEDGASWSDAIDPEDPFRGERPAIRLVETPMRRDSDKVIDLETRRARPRDGLSPGEQAAFREIGARLSEAAQPQPDASDTAEPDLSAPDAPDAFGDGDARPVFGKRQAPAAGDEPRDIEIDFSGLPAEDDISSGDLPGDDTGTTDGDAGPQDAEPHGAGDTREAEAAGMEESATEPATTDAPAADAPQDAAAEAPKPRSEWIRPQAPAAVPSAFALPARVQANLDASLVDAIPAALLVHAGERLIHANAEFLELTGYASLEALADAGGLDHLLDRPDDATAATDGGLLIRRGDGGAGMVTARLRSVNWGTGQALLLALAPLPEAAPETDPADDDAAFAAAGSPDEAAPALPATDETGPADATPAALPLTGDSRAEGADNAEAEALRIEAQELRSILETATDGVVILDHDGTIRSMNGSACALFNYDEGETRGEPFAMLFAHESQRAVMDYVSGLAEHGVSSVLNDGREVIGREASGGFLPLFMTIGRLSGSNGYCAVLRDITQWKRTEDELRTAKRAAETANSHKSDFLARVSHEIRTPLNAIIGFSEMMVEERFGPIGSPRYLEYAHDIGNSGKHVLDIVNDLLDISKIESGQEQLEFVAVSLNDHLAESVSLLQPMANSQRVIIRTSLSASVPDVVADRRSIKQIALNLLSNAIRFTPSGGQIVVSTSYEPSGAVVIRIRDTGIGMNRKELEQAMKPFGQVGPGPRQRGDGTGLGLPLTKAMVEANRAQFDIVSTPSEGTLVSISFPPQRVLAD